MKTPRIIRVRWVDSAACHGWHHRHEIDPEVTPIESIGWLVARNKATITISTSVTTEGRFVDPLTIPLCAVQKITRLKPFPK